MTLYISVTFLYAILYRLLESWAKRGLNNTASKSNSSMKPRKRERDGLTQQHGHARTNIIVLTQRPRPPTCCIQEHAFSQAGVLHILLKKALLWKLQVARPQRQKGEIERLRSVWQEAEGDQLNATKDKGVGGFQHYVEFLKVPNKKKTFKRGESWGV